MPTRQLFVFSFCSSLLFVQGAFAQSASLTFAGTVTNSVTGEPLPRALVTLNGYIMPTPGAPVTQRSIREPINRTVLTDASGGFRFVGLADASYNIHAARPGFTPDDAGTGRQTMKASDENVRLRLSPLGVITGQITDQSGEPMRGVGVYAMNASIVDGERHVTRARTVTTDDRGMYRMWNLTPGRYYLKVTGQGLTTQIGAASNTLRLDVGDSFFPVYSGGGQVIDEARPAEVGTTAVTADFHLKLAPAGRINGVLREFNRDEQIKFAIVVAGEEVDAAPDRFNSTSGVFQFNDVVAGTYIIRARQEGRSGEILVTVPAPDQTQVPLSLAADIDIPVAVRSTNSPKVLLDLMREEFLKEGLTRQDVEASMKEEELKAPCNISLTPQNLVGSTAALPTIFENDGYLKKVSPGKYRASIKCELGYAQSATVGAQDLLTNPILKIEPGAAMPPIEVLATWGGGSIKGKFETEIPTTDIVALLVPRFPASTGPTLENDVSPMTDGVTFRGLAPGTYSVYAFAHRDIEYRNPEFLRTLTGGETVQVDGSGEKQVTIHKVLP